MLKLSCVVLLLGGWPAHAAGPEDYRALKREIAREASTLRLHKQAGLEQALLERIDRLFVSWLGSRWGLGMPQSTEPHRGKTNCGVFVAVVLRDVGFLLPIWKFNRQAAYDSIRSLAPRRSIRYFHRVSPRVFAAGVRRMGPGLYLIGLDFHIGFLRVKRSGEVRFVHGSYLTHRVMDEPAETALPIVHSRSRMVGKILQPNMLRAWRHRRRIKVLGKR